MLESPSCPLGKKSIYDHPYDPSLLFAIARKDHRTSLGIYETLPFTGADLWTAYEVSWLTPSGKPVVAIAEFQVPCTSNYIFESKALKLYLNALNQTKFKSKEEVKQLICKDLSDITDSAVEVKLLLPEEFDLQKIDHPSAICLDSLEIAIDTYTLDRSFLIHAIENQYVEERLCSHLLKSNCLITNQPDWATVFINYRGKKIDHTGLLKYIVSLRQHNEFHEHCVERIYTDLMTILEPEQLTVYARYTRRGGIDINPFRTNWESLPENIRLARQ